jgi:hypothetical protein
VSVDGVRLGQVRLLAAQPRSSEDVPVSELANPAEDTIGKFQRPGDAAETQRLAAAAAYPMTGTCRRRVLDAIIFAGEKGATDEQLQRWLDLNPSTERPRRVELVEGGWIEDSTIRRATLSGRSAVVWTLTDAGLQAVSSGRSLNASPIRTGEAGNLPPLPDDAVADHSSVTAPSGGDALSGTATAIPYQVAVSGARAAQLTLEVA